MKLENDRSYRAIEATELHELQSYDLQYELQKIQSGYKNFRGTEASELWKLQSYRAYRAKEGTESYRSYRAKEGTELEKSHESDRATEVTELQQLQSIAATELVWLQNYGSYRAIEATGQNKPWRCAAELKTSA